MLFADIKRDSYNRWQAKIWEDGYWIDTFRFYAKRLELMEAIKREYPNISFGGEDKDVK